MEYEWLSGLLVIIGIIFLVLGIATLARGKWFVAWLRGMAGMMCVALACALALLAINVFSYQNLTAEATVATLSFERSDHQVFRVTVVLPDGTELTFRVSGDLWQIDAKILKWHGLLAAAGLAPGYKLDRLQGRYISLEDERSRERTVYALSEPDVGFDLWETIQSSGWLPWVDAVYGSATYLPMADGAMFSVSVAHSGLLARPMNEHAAVAVNDWN